MRGADPNPQTDGQTPTNEHVHEARETQDRADSRTRAGRIRAETPVDRAGTKPKSRRTSRNFIPRANFTSEIAFVRNKVFALLYV
jgi:hypothetical protein